MQFVGQSQKMFGDPGADERREAFGELPDRR
eukprot:CAMPEP_0198657198 /NCGR_PEP_ID=MMETSP1467-20131203/11890_1 /TAXON_ID=1462469 /ORGANISM="unid. sp., Strain CCMP2135" /LENGTH=30 /DNA_ID= /DNA_START= /DNA_END= /DNA_ORIENTATION=